MRQIRRAQREAQKVLRAIPKRKLPIDVFALAKKHAVLVQEPMRADLSGLLIPLEEPVEGKSWVIVANSTHPEVRRRFTVAHELGHLLLHAYKTTHADRGFKIRARNARSSDGSVREEIEANQFAAELLMPTDAIMKKIAEYELEYAPLDESDDETLAELAGDFRVSQQALFIRLANLLG